MQSKLQLKEFIIKLLKDNISSSYYYHTYKHTLYVHDKAIEIANHEKCTAKEMELLAAAALWHDTGFINTYSGHEEESCVLAKHYLPDYNYSAAAISQICGMIMVTKIPQSPKNKLDEILADADLEYLGTDLVFKQAENLYRELLSVQPNLTREQWNQIQISFLEEHHYFTKYCKENKEPKKLMYLNTLLNTKK
jgi:uncharacterized protein